MSLNGNVSSRRPFNSEFQENSQDSRPGVRSNLRNASLRRVSGQIRFLCLVIADAAAFVLACIIAQAVIMVETTLPASSWPRLHLILDPGSKTWNVTEILFVAAIFCTHLGTRGHYTQRVPVWTETGEIIGSGFLVLLCDCVLQTGVYGNALLSDVVLRWVIAIPLVLVGRHLTRAALRAAGLSTLRTVVVGDASSAQRLISALGSEASLGYQVVGEIEPEVIRGHDTQAALLGLLAQFNADFVALASPLEERDEANLVAVLDRARIPFALMPNTQLLPVLYDRPQYFFSHNVTLLARQHTVVEPLSRASKIAFDFLIAAILIVLIAPLLAVIALAIRMDGGPSLFRHNRLGANKHTFQCMKFRTMRVDSDAVLASILATDPVAAAEWADIQKLRCDPRITRVGRLLRKSSLDELPQLFNVLRGEMSLVGPRPIVRSEAAFYGDDIDYYYQARPGLTGLWQVSGRNNTTYARRVQLDVWYVKNWTFWHDITILMKTVPAVLLRHGAH
jgi:Undecaprenyl-phosphate galactose phosphotransferase WbaP